MKAREVHITGAGIVGLSTAYHIALMWPDWKITIHEKEDSVSAHQTGHNSGVIHSGIYYQPGSLKAVNCRKGYSMLLDFCDEHGVSFDLCGKIIVATSPNEIGRLNKIMETGEQNGLDGLRWMEPDEIKEREPNVKGIRAIFVPQTGIIQFSDVAKKLVEILVEKGHKILFDSRVTGLKKKGDQWLLSSSQGEFQADIAIHCAGLYADKTALFTRQSLDYRIIPFRGEYYKLKPEYHELFHHLIYPVPNPDFPFLGVHFTRMMNGEKEAGPNAVLALKREGYTWSQFSLREFIDAIRWPGLRILMSRYWRTGLCEMYRSFSPNAFTRELQRLIPEIRTEYLEKGEAGVRAMAISRNGDMVDDFLILKENNLIDVINAPSPAATSGLAIGQHVASLVREFN